MDRKRVVCLSWRQREARLRWFGHPQIRDGGYTAERVSKQEEDHRGDPWM